MIFFIFPFAAFGVLIVAGVLLRPNAYTIEGWAMAIAFGIAPICLFIAVLLGVWHLWRSWTGANEPRMGLGLKEH